MRKKLCWLDFEHAGRNALAGDIANFLWYLLGMGGWLVPAYQAEVYARTLCMPVPPAAVPVIDHLRVTTRHVEIDYTWRVGAGRHAALAALLHRLAGDLGAVLAPAGDMAAALRPFLVVRVLGVIPLRQLKPQRPGRGVAARPPRLPRWRKTCPRSTMTDRVRALLITPDDDLLTIQRIRPGQDPYWVLPGGGVEPGEDLETALARELREEIAATAGVHSLLHILEHDGERQYFYLARARTWSAEPGDRTGPEFTDPARGEYHLQPIPLTARALAGINLKPDTLAQHLLGHLRAGTDLFTLPDLRASLAASN